MHQAQRVRCVCARGVYDERALIAAVVCGAWGRHQGEVLRREVCVMAQARGLCKRHGAHGACTHKACATVAVSARKLCAKHGGEKEVTCSAVGCRTPA